MDLTESFRSRLAAYPSLKRARNPFLVAKSASDLLRQVSTAMATLQHCDDLAQGLRRAAGSRSLFQDTTASIAATSAAVKQGVAKAQTIMASVEGSVAREFAPGTQAAEHWSVVTAQVRKEAQRITTLLQSLLRTRARTVRQRARAVRKQTSAVVTGGWVPGASMQEAVSRLGRTNPRSTPHRAIPPASSSPVTATTAATTTPSKAVRGTAHTSQPSTATHTPSSSRGRSSYVSQQLQGAAVHRRAVVREEEAADVERAVVEVGVVVQQMAGLVESQGETLGRIDTHLSDAQHHLDKSEVELAGLLRVVSRNRVFIIAMLIVVGIVLVTVAAGLV